MNIAFLATKFSPVVGGGESHIATVVNHLHKAGNEVHVLTGVHSLRNKALYPFTIHEIPHFTDHGVSFAAIKAINKVLTGLQPEILHIVNYEAAAHLAYISPSDTTTYVFSTYNTPLPHRRIFGGLGDYQLEKRAVTLMMAGMRVDAFVANSKTFLQGLHSDLGLPTKNVNYIPFGIDTRFFSPRDNSDGKRATSVRKILCTSRFVNRKGIEHLIAAMDQLPAEYSLLLTGSGSVHDESAHTRLSYAARSSRHGNITLTEKTQRLTQLREFYRSTDIFVMPSEYEGFGLAALEAMACGTPVIATRVQGLDEFIRHEETGLLVDYARPNQIAESIVRLSNDAVLRNRIIDNALTMARKDFDERRMNLEYENLYESILSKIELTGHRVRS
jgi:glycosyltransferase involved in cell wall biosynthesis